MRPEPDPARLSSLLATVSTTLLLFFVLAMLVASMPPRLLGPSWQLNVSEALIHNA